MNMEEHHITSRDVLFEEALHVDGHMLLLLAEEMKKMFSDDEIERFADSADDIFTEMNNRIYESTDGGFSQILVMAGIAFDCIVTLLFWDHTLAFSMDIDKIEEEMNGE